MRGFEALARPMLGLDILIFLGYLRLSMTCPRTVVVVVISPNLWFHILTHGLINNNQAKSKAPGLATTRSRAFDVVLGPVNRS